MARNRWQEDESFEIPLTPLIDIIFILIVFFLVATTFYTEERDLEIRLPEGTEGDLVAQQEDLYVINVREGGVITVASRIVTMQELESELRSLPQGDAPKVEIRGDTNARHGKIMRIMNLCKECGVSDYALTQRIVRETP